MKHAPLGRLVFLIALIVLLPCQAEKTQRIVSLSPAMTEILFAIGAGGDVVARTTECDYPEEALFVPAIGGFDGKSISVERVISCRPSLVCGAMGMHDWLSSVLETLGITLYLSGATDLATVMNEITELGALTGCKEGAQKTVQTMQETLRSAKDAAKANSSSCSLSDSPPLVYWEVYSSPLMAAGASSFMSDILTRAGGKNIFADIIAAYPAISAESVIVRNPAIIILAQDAFKNKEEAVKALRRRPGWDGIDAVKTGRIILVGDAALRPGPRAAKSVLLLAKSMQEDMK